MSTGGIYDVVTLESVITKVKRPLGLKTNSDYDADIADYINEGVGKLKNLRMYKKKVCTIDVDSHLVKLPKGYFHMLGARLVDVDDSDENSNLPISSSFPINGAPLTYMDYRWLSDCNIDPSLINTFPHRDFRNSWQEEDGYFIFNSDVTGFNKLQLSYMGLRTNSQGDMVIYADYVEAVRDYAIYKFCAEPAHEGMFSQTTIERYFEDYKAAKKYIRGDDQVRAHQKNKANLRNVIHSLLVDMWVPE